MEIGTVGSEIAEPLADLFVHTGYSKEKLVAVFRQAGVPLTSTVSKAHAIRSGMKKATDDQAKVIAKVLLGMLRTVGLLDSDEDDGARNLQNLRWALGRVGGTVSAWGELEWEVSEPIAGLGNVASLTERDRKSMSRVRTSATLASKPSRVVDPRAVFVVHGRNASATERLKDFLSLLDAKPISWTDAARATKVPRPTTLEIIEAGMAMAQAIVVLFSPDDEAKLKDGFVTPADGPEERNLTGQARQNVTLEAGMAMALAPESTIFVRIGRPREISDIQGINWITLGDTWESRVRLQDGLRAAGVRIPESVNLLDGKVGNFDSIDLDSL